MKNLIIFVMISTFSLSLSGCLPKPIGSRVEKGNFIETREISTNDKIESSIKSSKNNDSVGVAVESNSVKYANIADFYEKKQVDSYTGCGIGDLLSVTVGLPFFWLVKLMEAPYCIFGDDYSETKLLPGQYELDNSRTIVKNKTRVNANNKINVYINGTNIGTVTPGADGNVLISSSELIGKMWPNYTNNLCFEFGGSKSCNDFSPDEINQYIKRNPKKYISLREQYYTNCTDKNDLYGCLWSATLYSNIDPKDSLRARNSYFRSCVFSEQNVGCEDASKLGAAREVEDVLAKKVSVARAKAENQRYEAEVKAKELALEQERERIAREEEEQREEQERIRARQEREENTKMWMDGLKQLSDGINESYQQQQQRRSIYGY